MKHTYIAIEGNIGAGKSTLAQHLVTETGAVFMPERFEDNPFLPLFYKNQERYAFTVELSFLEDRVQQVMQCIQNEQVVVSDYLWAKSLVFARVNLKGEELQLFERLYAVMTKSLPKPDVIIYLHRNTDHLLGHIGKRGRDYEQEIQVAYLERVEKAYRDYFQAEREIPVLWLTKPETEPYLLFQRTKVLLKSQFSPGLHEIV
ncbi:MAG: deoxynucleoside kinase [Bacteroidia bacterium]